MFLIMIAQHFQILQLTIAILYVTSDRVYIFGSTLQLVFLFHKKTHVCKLSDENKIITFY